MFILLIKKRLFSLRIYTYKMKMSFGIKHGCENKFVHQFNPTKSLESKQKYIFLKCKVKNLLWPKASLLKDFLKIMPLKLQNFQQFHVHFLLISISAQQLLKK